MRLTESQVRGIVAGILSESEGSYDHETRTFYREAMTRGGSAAIDLDEDLRRRYDPSGTLGMRLISTTMQVIREIDDLNRAQAAQDASAEEKRGKVSANLDDVVDAFENLWGLSQGTGWKEDDRTLMLLANLKTALVTSVESGADYFAILSPDAYRFFHGLYDVTKNILAQGYDPNSIVDDSDADALSDEIKVSVEDFAELTQRELSFLSRKPLGHIPGMLLSSRFRGHDDKVWDELSDTVGISLENIELMIKDLCTWLIGLVRVYGADTARHRLTGFTNFATRPFAALRQTPLEMLQIIDSTAWEMSQP